MASSVQKITLVFDAPGHGWTESHFRVCATDDPNEGLANSTSVGLTRSRLLGTGAQVTYMRSSVEITTVGTPQRGDAQIRKVNYVPNWGQTPQPLDEPDAALMLRWNDAGHQRHKNVYLRGIPDAIDQSYGTYFPAAIAGYSDLLSAYTDQLILGNLYGWLGQNQAGVFDVTGYVSDPATGLVTVTLGGAPFTGASTQPQQVRFQGINQGNSKLNGLHVVRPSGSNTCKLTKPLALINYQGLGRMTTYTRSFIPYSGYQPRDIHTRRVGAPLLESRGRGRRRATT